jgi:hypothetical protein
MKKVFLSGQIFASRVNLAHRDGIARTARLRRYDEPLLSAPLENNSSTFDPVFRGIEAR